MKVGETTNEFGTPVSKHVCDTCGDEFTVCPATDKEGWENCLAKTCASYDPARDADRFFKDDNPKEDKIVNLDAQRPHRVIETICVKCLHRTVAVAPIETPLIKYECETCGPGYVIATGQWQDER